MKDGKFKNQKITLPFLILRTIKSNCQTVLAQQYQATIICNNITTQLTSKTIFLKYLKSQEIFNKILNNQNNYFTTRTCKNKKYFPKWKLIKSQRSKKSIHRRSQDTVSIAMKKEGPFYNISCSKNNKNIIIKTNRTNHCFYKPYNQITKENQMMK